MRLPQIVSFPEVVFHGETLYTATGYVGGGTSIPLTEPQRTIGIARKRRLQQLLPSSHVTTMAIVLILVLTLTAGLTCAAQHGGAFPVNQLGLVPLPRHVIAYKAQWHLAAKVRLAADNPAERNTAQFLQRF